MISGHVAVIDIGKTNAKLALVDLADFSEVAVLTRPNIVLSGPPWPHFDVEGLWGFILDALTKFQAELGIDAISITTHGACAALLAIDGGLAAPILDYEHTGPEETADAYDAIRPAFDETGSPRLAMGLNIGAQLFWQFQTDPTLLDRTHRIVTYPQYWGHRLSGVAATDVTSLGCHTDLWNPYKGQFSSLVDRMGITDKIAPARPPGHVLGPILPEISMRTGIAAGTPVYCGIHDSNASLLPHILRHKFPFSVVSTGTWVIAMAIGARPVKLDPKLDTLINVNAMGHPVPSARFMGGREFDLATKGQSIEPTEADIADVLAHGIMLLPAVVRESGPFFGKKARWRADEPAPETGRRTAAVSFYLALVTAYCLELISHEGPIIVEGPFTKNLCFLQMLAIASGAKVHPSSGATGTSQGAAMLALEGDSSWPFDGTGQPIAEALPSEMGDYARRWKTNL